MGELIVHWSYAAIESIKKTMVSHRNWKYALNDTFAFLTVSDAGEVVCITGPSQAGKSQLIKTVSSLIVGEEIGINVGVMPVMYVLATNCSIRGSFSTKAFTIRALEAVKHPIYGIAYDDYIMESKRLKLLNRTSEGVLRQAFEHAIRQRKVRYIVIDEAQHIQYLMGNSAMPSAILESWKCLAQETNTTLVLVGAYPLLDIIRLCPHLLGRKQQVHLPRYSYVEEDLIAFSEIIDVYGQFVTLPPSVESLNEWAEILYEESMGCVGLLGRFLRGALTFVAANNDNTLTLNHLNAARRPAVEQREIAEEIRKGEGILGARTFEFYSNNVLENAEMDNAVKRVKKRKGKPFQRNPKRYEIGGRT